MNKKLIYCTISYPFETAHYWKEVEILEFANSYTEVHVIPFMSNYNKLKAYRDFPSNVKLHRPILNSGSRFFTYFINTLRLPFSKSRNVYFSEFRRNKVYKSKAKLKNWLINTIFQEIGLNSQTWKGIKPILDSSTDIIYYWGRSNYFVPLVNEKIWCNSYLRLHGADIFEERHAENYLPYRPELYQKFDKILNITDQGKQYLSDKYGEWIKDKCAVSYLGALNYGINNSMPSDKLVLLSCSYIYDIKRIQLIIDILSNCTTPVHWVHIGGDSIVPQQYSMQKLKDLAEQKLDTSLISYKFLGSIPMKEVPVYMANEQVDLFINVSYSEGLPVTIMEAMGASIPIIAPNIGGINEILENNKNGYLINRDFDPTFVANLLSQHAKKSTAEIQQMKNESREVYNNKLDMVENTKKLVSSFNN